MKFDKLYESIINESIIESHLLEFCLFVESDNLLTEDVDLFESDGKIGKALGKAGLHLHKSNGLIHMIAKSGKQFGKIILALWRARKGGEEAKANLKKVIEDSKVSKEQMLDFLLKLDQATLHMITGPLHVLDAIMGWHIAPHIEKKSGGMTDKIKDAFEKIVSTIKALPNEIAKKIKPAVDNAQSAFKAHLNIG